MKIRKREWKERVQMKKVICLIISVLSIFVFVSCGSGVSVPYRTVQLANRYSEIFDSESGISAFHETLEYPDFRYELYYEKAESGQLLTYNICEKAGDYTMRACDGSILMEKGGKTYDLLVISGTYSGFANEYADFAHPLDAGNHYQASSEKTADGGYNILYKAEVTPQMAGELSEYGVVLGEYIFSRHIIDENYFCLSIEYSTGKSEGERKLLTRTFEYYSEPQTGYFENMPAERDAKVRIVYSGGRTAEFSVPTGCHIGFYMPDVIYDFYTDENCELPFEADSTPIFDDMILYAKATGKKG